MLIRQQACQVCGGDLMQINEKQWKCKYCGSIYEDQTVEDNIDMLHQLLDEMKIEAIANARKNLYDAINADYISNQIVHECCMAIKQYLPDDFQANFYDTAIGSNGRKIARSIRKINVEEQHNYIENIISFLIRSLQSEYILETNDLIERAYKLRDLEKFNKYATELSVEAEKIEDCIYMTTYPRDVFVAYSSKDMDTVSELVDNLESQGISCFVAARNLRHGKGAVENYDRALKEAMDNCHTFVYISSTNSRHPGCDALRKEIPYIKSVDIASAPAEFRNDYPSIPHKYKKPRVEYRIEESARFVAADRIVNDFFDGYERVYTADEVADRVLSHSIEQIDDEMMSKHNEVKYCLSCKSEVDLKSKFCNNCGSNRFAGSMTELELMLKVEELNKKLAISSFENEKNEAEEAARRAAEEAARKAAEEARRKEIEEMAKQMAEAKAKRLAEEAERKAAEEAERKASEEAARKSAEEDARKAAEEARRKEIEEMAKRMAEAKAKRLAEEAERKAAEETERRAAEEAARHAAEEAKRKAEETKKRIAEEREKQKLRDEYLEAQRYTSYNNDSKKALDIEAHAHIGENNLKRFSAANVVINECLANYKENGIFVNIPEGITKIGNAAFRSKHSLKRVTLPNGLKQILQEAFWDCKYIENVKLPDGLTSIGESAFWNCRSITEMNIPESVCNIGKDAFKFCDNLSKVNIPESLTKINEGVFSGCAKLQEIDIPKSVKSILHNAFCDCIGLESVTIPASVDHIADNAFEGCVNLQEVQILGNIGELRSEMFDRCVSLKKITVPKEVLVKKGSFERTVKINYI